MKDGIYLTKHKYGPGTRKVEVKNGSCRVVGCEHWFKVEFFFEVNEVIKEQP